MKKKLLLIGLIAMTSLMLAQVPTTGLIAKWEFTGNLNDGVGSNHGTWLPGGAPTYTVDRCGTSGTALHFDGATNCVKMIAGGISGAGARSLSFWMKTTNTAAGGGFGFVKVMFNDGIYSSSSTATRWEIDHNYSCQGVGVDISQQYITKPSPCVNDGVWHHIVVTQAASSALNTAKIYLDGAQMVSTNCSPTSNTAINATLIQLITIGAIYNGALPGATLTRFFSGDLDDFYYYSSVLSPSEVLQLYNDKCTPVPDPLCSGTGTVDPPTSECCLGNLCSNTQNPLAGSYQIPMNNNDFYFSDDADFTDKVNVGHNCSVPGIGKLNSETSRFTNPGAAGGNGDPESISIYGNNLFSQPGTGVGVMGNALNRQGGTSIGVWGDGIGTGDNIGGKFFAGSFKPSTNTYNIGVSTVAKPSTGNTPPYTYLSVYPNGANIGIYATGELNNTDPDHSAAGPDWAAWFDGDVNVVGSCWLNSTTWQFSDKRLKKDIKPLENISEKIKKLNGYTYSFRTEEFKQRGFDNQQHIGFIAQELKEVFPELIKEDAKGFYAVDYQGMIPVLLQAVKEQQIQAEKQQRQMDELKELLQTLIGSPSKKTTTSLPVSLSDKNVIVLNQNVPNPFAESTVITYNLPADFTKAQIIFTTNDGMVIKTINITEKGSGSLSVFANDLSHGMYTYTLVIDGKTIDSKKMIKE
ncbi:tail fiber domain-containing protein [Aurantibacillus circumpalustris]|uniref:tail fiber domain-containing protein n=1 Tax=Aurantibacillus circumpalustris TaxID=3036359 RepID=UPI00295C1AA2|nr:tail fiber domain-containing protein [Aurantibacillus circumpalustris]